MKKFDYSKEIYDKYYNSKGRILEVFLKDGSIIEGTFTGVFHGDSEAGEPFVIKWHFIPGDKTKEYNSAMLSNIYGQSGWIIKQEDIMRVCFRK